MPTTSLSSPNPAKIDGMLRTTSDYLRSVDMGISAAKCKGFHIRRSGNACVSLLADLTIDSQHNIMIQVDSVCKSEEVGGAQTASKGCPSDVVLCTNFPHCMTINTPSQNKLEAVDLLLPREVKKVLHIQRSMSDRLFYSRKRNGGLNLTLCRAGQNLRAARRGGTT